MAQFGRPDSNVTQTSFTGGFAEIDEASPSDTDFAYGANNTAAELEVGLADVTDPVSSSGHIFRYRIAKTNAGVVDGAGNAVTVTARLLQGTTEIAADTAKTATGTWTGYAFTLSAAQADAITDYADLRLEFVTSASGGSPAARRGGAVSWAELEVPDAPVAGPEGGSTATVAAIPAGAGSKAGQGGATITAPAVGSGSGTKAVSGGQLAELLAAAQAQGTKQAEGGATPALTITATGAGEPGAGEFDFEGGSTAAVLAAAMAAGLKAGEGGGPAVIALVATGQGSKAAQGGLAALIAAVGQGSGTGAHEGGAEALGAVIAAMGGGTRPGVQPWARLADNLGPVTEGGRPWEDLLI